MHLVLLYPTLLFSDTTSATTHCSTYAPVGYTLVMTISVYGEWKTILKEIELSREKRYCVIMYLHVRMLCSLLLYVHSLQPHYSVRFMIDIHIKNAFKIVHGNVLSMYRRTLHLSSNLAHAYISSSLTYVLQHVYIYLDIMRAVFAIFMFSHACTYKVSVQTPVHSLLPSHLIPSHLTSPHLTVNICHYATSSQRP
jgi:hypothetical protein